MIRNPELLVRELSKKSSETPWLEFKCNNADPQMIGERVSGLANSAVLHMKEYGYIIWGISDDDHSIVGTSFNPLSEKKGNEPLVNWLRHQITDNIDFEFENCDIDGKSIVILRVSRAAYKPASFENVAYIRDGSITKRLDKVPALHERLWSELKRTDFETLLADVDLASDDVLSQIDYTKCFDLLSVRLPSNYKDIIQRLIDNNIIVTQEDGLYALTNLGAILFAKDVSKYPSISRKTLRIIQYKGRGRTTISRQIEDVRGYAISFEDNIRLIESLLPAEEVIEDGIRKTVREYPTLAIREALANAMIHQDFTLTGMNLSVEIFDNRVELSNPGSMLIDATRIIDSSPKSRNEKLSSLMRRMHLCEELGTGWDKIVDSCESNVLPTPEITENSDSIRVTIYGKKPFRDMSSDERVYACYMHACSQHEKGLKMTNSSLRQRFGLDNSNSSSAIVSRIIKNAIDKGLVKHNGSANQYIPGWA